MLIFKLIQVERERLQMQAEGEIIKMRTRRANIGHEPLTVGG